MRMVLVGALLIAAPLASQTAKNSPPPLNPSLRAGKFHWLTLSETPKQVEAIFGPPAMVAKSGSQWIAWQYRLADDVAHEDFSHQLIFDRTTARLLSLARNYELEKNVDQFFPEKETSRRYYPNESAPQLTLRIRPLPNGLLLIALGNSGPTNQIVLLRREFLTELYPWLKQAQ